MPFDGRKGSSMANPLCNTAAGNQWRLFGAKKRHGINTPLFSLHSQTSGGIGEYTDLLPLIPWCKKMGFTIIQLLPLNDTGHDTSPYNAISSCALNPLHLSLHSLPGKEKHQELFQALESLRALNLSPYVDYPKVRLMKMNWLKQYYPLMKAEIHCEQFLNDNPWLKSYALFKALKEDHEWKNWEEWPTEHIPKNSADFDKLYQQFQGAADFHIFVQYLCFKQMQDVKKQAQQAGVLLKGDVPILISPDSADVWHEQHLFRMDLAAGAPPDMYNEDGQYWGFPLYNWEAMEAENYRWWTQRLTFAKNFYHLYRLDHVVGFFRIWAIARGEKSKEGHFEPEDENLWIPGGEKILQMMLQNNSMMPIGEDLGAIPPEVRESLLRMGICGTKVLRWEREWKIPGQPYIPLDQYPEVSMTTVSTHDSEQVNVWWASQAEEAKTFAQMKGWDYTVPLPLEQYQQILWDSHHTTSLLHINLLQEYLGLFPELHSENPEEERINIPGILSNRNWSFRYKPTVEQLVNHEGLKQRMRELIQ